MNKAKKLTRSILCLLAALLFALSPLTAPVARADTKSQIAALQEQLKELEAQAQAQQEVINALTENRALVVDRKMALDSKIEITQRQIQLIRSQIEIYDGIVAEKEEELRIAQEAEDAQAELLRARIRVMEESGNNNYLTFLFESESLTDLLSRLADVNDIMHYDQALEEQYRAAREDVEAIKAGYEETRAQQEDLSKELDRKTEELNAQIESAYTLIKDLYEQEDAAQAEFDAIDEARAKADAEIDALLAKLAAEEAARKAAEQAAAAAAASSGSTYTAPSSAVSLTNLTWPCPGCNIITSRFGYRVSPTAGASSYHGGLDIGAAEGASIVAAEGGTVILATYNGGYGNCVMINHGNGIVTLYGHMSGYAVGYGQTVAKGQVIGYVGSTGVSTGPHCHFEIRINGAQTDPAPYFSGLVYYC